MVIFICVLGSVFSLLSLQVGAQPLGTNSLTEAVEFKLLVDNLASWLLFLQSQTSLAGRREEDSVRKETEREHSSKQGRDQRSEEPTSRRGQWQSL